MNCIHESLEQHKARAASNSIGCYICLAFILNACFSESLKNESHYVLREANSLEKMGHLHEVSGYYFPRLPLAPI